MANYPQPPFKKFVKTDSGLILEVGNKNSYLDKNGNWEIEHKNYEMLDDKKTLCISMCCSTIVATADSKEELIRHL